MSTIKGNYVFEVSPDATVTPVTVHARELISIASIPSEVAERSSPRPPREPPARQAWISTRFASAKVDLRSVVGLR